jgi:hypothetical protein
VMGRVCDQLVTQRGFIILQLQDGECGGHATEATTEIEREGIGEEWFGSLPCSIARAVRSLPARPPAPITVS